jgi:hypothetical protein
MAELQIRARAIAATVLAPRARGGFGQEAMVIGAAPAGYDPATRTAETVPAPIQTGSGVEVAYEARDIDGTLVRAGDRKFLLSPVTTSGYPLDPPAVDDQLAVAGRTWTIKAVLPFAPAGEPLYYALNLRR